MKRNCIVCGSNREVRIHTQKYLLPSRRNFFAYDVVACKQCGFVFADNIPTQKASDKYYKESNKYTYSSNVPAGLLAIYRDIHANVDRFLARKNALSRGKGNFAILDIGCSIGSLLNIFKQHGFQYLTGIEPSQNCSRLAKELYGINVFPGLLSEFKCDRQFDLVMMTGVLEHISDFDRILPQAIDYMKDSGMLMIVVPDAGKFSLKPKSPFDEFSIEHINYFTNTALSNLMNNYCLTNIYHKSIKTIFYDSCFLISYFKKSHLPQLMKKDTLGTSRINKYIKLCNDKLNRLNTKLEKLIAFDKDIVVWGVGSLTYRLLATSSLAKIKISAFVDSNSSLQGGKIRNVQIFSPDYFDRNAVEAVFIASHIYGKEIEHILRNKHHFTGSILHI